MHQILQRTLTIHITLYINYSLFGTNRSRTNIQIRFMGFVDARKEWIFLNLCPYRDRMKGEFIDSVRSSWRFEREFWEDIISETWFLFSFYDQKNDLVFPSPEYHANKLKLYLKLWNCHRNLNPSQTNKSAKQGVIAYLADQSAVEGLKKYITSILNSISDP